MTQRSSKQTILGISGSLRTGSSNLALLSAIASLTDDRVQIIITDPLSSTTF